MAKFFRDLRKRLEKFKQLNADYLAYKLANTSRFQELVVELNTQKQLYDKGEDSRGEMLSDIGGDYSPVTMQWSKEKGKPKKSASDINLHDTGDFYKSFTVTPFIGGFEIDATTHFDDADLEKDWGEDIVGLNEENLQIIRDEHQRYFQEEIAKI